MNKLVSIIVPAFNEEAVIEEFYDRVISFASKEKKYSFELVFINDGSSDKTESILNEISLKDNRVKVIHFAQNMGHQIALFAGMEHAAGDYIVTIDSDLQDPPETIPDLLEKLDEGFDIVHGQRTKRPGESLFKLFTAWLFYKFMKHLSGINIIPNCGDFRAFTRQVLQTVISFRGSSKFLRGTFVEIGYKQVIVKYKRDIRYSGKTKYSLIKMIRFAIDGILSFSTFPIKLIVVMSLFFWSVSLAYFIRSLYMHYGLGITVPGWTSVITLLYFFTGLILFSISVIGIYIGRIFKQCQSQPLYWVSYKRNC